MGGNPLSGTDPLGLVELLYLIPKSTAIEFVRKKGKEFGVGCSKYSDQEVLGFIGFIPEKDAKDFQRSYDCRPGVGTKMAPELWGLNKREAAYEKVLLNRLFKD